MYRHTRQDNPTHGDLCRAYWRGEEAGLRAFYERRAAESNRAIAVYLSVAFVFACSVLASAYAFVAPALATLSATLNG